MSPERAAAFFDFDRTVHDGDAGVLFAQELLRIRRRRVRDQAPGTLGWVARVVAFEARIARLYAEAAALQTGSAMGLVKRSRVLAKVYQMMRGLEHEDLRALAHDFFDEVLTGRLLPDARAEMERHRGEGRPVIVVSTGMRLLVEHVKRHLPVNHVIAVDLLAKDGRLTGRVTGPLWGRQKAKAVREWAHAHHVSLPRSWAYSDHRSDLPFLRLVGHPVAVNPDWRLAAHAKRRGWAIVRWKRRST